MTRPNFAVLDELVSLISSSVNTIKSEWEKNAISAPDIDSVQTTAADASATRSVTLTKAHQVLEGACAQLVATTAIPTHHLVNMSMGAITVSSLRIVCETKVAGHLEAAGSEGLPVSDLAVKTGVESGKLARILRLLASRHVFREVKEDVFANNRLSIRLHPNHPVSTLVGHITDEAAHAAWYLYESLVDPKSGPSYAPELAPVSRALPLNGANLFQWYTQPEGRSYGARLSNGLSSWEEGIAADDIMDFYPWKKLPAGSTITDVGSGVGHISLSFALACPSVKIVLQDLAPVLEDGKNMWETKLPGAFEQQRVQMIPIDFLRESPVADSDIYFLKGVIHDWPDKECETILRNIRKVMAPHSKVLIQEVIVQPANRVPANEAAFEQAPEPLLPNYGMGRQRQHNQDITMLNLFNAKERTLKEFVNLGAAVGLKFLKVYDLGEAGVMEFGIDS